MGTYASEGPPELKPILKVFDGFLYRHDAAQVFDDWLQIMICCFAFETMEEEYKQVAKKYDKAMLETLSEMMGRYIQLQSEQAGREIHREGVKHVSYSWYDGIGHIYEIISSYGKKQGLGQFFTPEHVVDMMVLMKQNTQDDNVLDPACGSGRFLVAAHCNNPGPGIKTGVDIDQICFKMTAVNMFMHGCTGEAIWADGLDLYDYRRGYVINLPGRPGIYTLPKEKSFYHRFCLKKAEEFKTQATERRNKEGLEDSLFSDGVETVKQSSRKVSKPKQTVDKIIIPDQPTLF